MHKFHFRARSTRLVPPSTNRPIDRVMAIAAMPGRPYPFRHFAAIPQAQRLTVRMVVRNPTSRG